MTNDKIKIALVTGATSRGLNKNTALALAKKGGCVAKTGVASGVTDRVKFIAEIFAVVA